MTDIQKYLAAIEVESKSAYTAFQMSLQMGPASERFMAVVALELMLPVVFFPDVTIESLFFTKTHIAIGARYLIRLLCLQNATLNMFSSCSPVTGIGGTLNTLCQESLHFPLFHPSEKLKSVPLTPLDLLTDKLLLFL